MTMTIKANLERRLIDLEEKEEAKSSKGTEKIDFYALARRSRRRKKVLNAIYDAEGIEGLQRRHEKALACNRHRVPKWLAGHRRATEYSVFIEGIKREIDSMNEFIKWWGERRDHMLKANDPRSTPCPHLERALEAAKRGNLRAYKEAWKDSVMT